MNYDEVFSRNIGLFSTTEQERLRNATVLVAGVGGVGGVQAVTLARFGIGNMILIDPGEFDPPDMNRQYGATVATMGKNKAKSTADLLKEVNPFLNLCWYDHQPSSEMLNELAVRASIVIDAIDYSVLEYKIALAQAARKAGLLNLSCPIPDFAAHLMIFDPEGMSVEEFYDVPSDPQLWADFMIPPERFFGKHIRPQNIYDFVEGRTKHISTNAGAAMLSGALLATEVALILSGKRSKQSIVTIPQVTYVDLIERICSVYNARELGS